MPTIGDCMQTIYYRVQFANEFFASEEIPWDKVKKLCGEIAGAAMDEDNEREIQKFNELKEFLNEKYPQFNFLSGL